MCDALSRNTPKLAGVEVLLANCLAHGRRQVVDVAANFRKNPGMCWRLWARFT
jgi:transposase